MTPAMQWVAGAESAATAPQLARCLRALDAAIQVHACTHTSSSAAVDAYSLAPPPMHHSWHQQGHSWIERQQYISWIGITFSEAGRCRQVEMTWTFVWLILQLASLQWDQLRAPGGASMESQWRGCELRQRRVSQHPVGGFEYLVFARQQHSQQVQPERVDTFCLCKRADAMLGILCR